MTIVIPTHDKRLHRAWWDAIHYAAGWDGTPPPRFDPAWALRIIGRADIHPGDVFAYTQPTRRRALLSARANREVYGHPIIGVVEVDPLGWVVVLDLRPALTAADCPLHQETTS